jgi:cyanophycin synthetase
MQLDAPQLLLGINPWLERDALRFRIDLSQLKSKLARNNPKRKAMRTLPTLVPALQDHEEFQALCDRSKKDKFDLPFVAKLVATSCRAILAKLMFREVNIEIRAEDAEGVYTLVATSHELEMTGQIVSFAFLATLGSLGNDVVEQLPPPNVLSKQINETWSKLEQTVNRDGLPMQHRFLVAEARTRGIRWQRILRRPALLHFGSGRHWRRLELTTTDRTGYLAATTAAKKPRATALMQMMAVPVPVQFQVSTVEQALAAANKIGYPVVTKPMSGNRGRGVSANLKNDAELRVGFQRAAAINKTVLVEDFIVGEDYRVLVIDGECVAAVKRVPPSVVGDGTLSVRRLIDKANANRFRPDGLPRILSPLPDDDEAKRIMAKSGWDLSSVPPEGTRVYLRSVANGGSTEDVTASIHPDNAMAAVRAAQVLGVDVAGADFISPDITKSFREVGGGLNECNYKPDLFVHILADGDDPPDVVGALFDYLFPADSPRGLHAVVVMGAEDDTVGALVETITAEISREDNTRVGGLGPAGLFSALGAVEPLHNFALQAPKVFLDTGLDVGVFGARVDASTKDGLGVDYLSLLVLPNIPAPGEDETALLLRAAQRCEGPVLVERGHPLTDLLAERISERLHVVSPEPSPPAPPSSSTLGLDGGAILVCAPDGAAAQRGPSEANFNAMVARFAVSRTSRS